MGLAEYIKSGVQLTRNSTVLDTTITGSGSVELGSVYGLLSITTTVPCRLRLYDNEYSRDVATEIARTFGNTNVAANIALVGDFSMSAIGTYTIDPVLYGFVETASTKLTYYRIDNVSTPPYPKITFNTYLMENSSITTNGRKNFPEISAVLSQGQSVRGVINSIQIPRTYLLISGSLSGSANNIARVRLYYTSQSLTNAVEVSRSFATESAANSNLIIDAILSGSETTYFVPKIAGANLNTIESNLNLIKGDVNKIMGNNEIYYILQNISSSVTPVSMSVSFHIFSLED